MDDIVGKEYPLEYIMANPIPARCKKCKAEYTDGQLHRICSPSGKVKIVVCNEAIRAPSLSCCRCWDCWGELGPLEKGGPTTVEQVAQLNSLKEEQPCLQLF